MRGLISLTASDSLSFRHKSIRDSFLVSSMSLTKSFCKKQNKKINWYNGEKNKIVIVTIIKLSYNDDNIF